MLVTDIVCELNKLARSTWVRSRCFEKLIAVYRIKLGPLLFAHFASEVDQQRLASPSYDAELKV